MTPIQQLMLGVGAKKKTYLDDVFSNYLWRGNSTNNRAINVGVNYASNEGLVWIKNRQDTDPHCLFDTIRGAGKRLASNDNSGQTTTSVELKSFTSTGYTLGTDGTVNGNTKPFSSWNFKSAPGFFDVVSWTGNGTSGRQIPHSLGSVPGSIWVRRYDGNEDWTCYHRSLGNTHYVQLNKTSAADDDTRFNDTDPTSTYFTVDDHGRVNQSGWEYIAYVFAGGESTAATAKSVEFDGNTDYLSVADHADFDIGTNWTAECWFKADGFASLSYNGIMGQWPGTSSGNAWVLEYVGTDLRFYLGDNSFKSLGAAPLGQWHHVAISKEGSTTRIFLNGTQVVADYDMGTYAKDGAFTIGGSIAGGGWFDGKISNVRIVKGTAVYTSSFRPPTEPLTNITNTVLLCCNDSSQTGSTVTPGTITNYNSTASTDSPFDDPAAFTFGENGDQAIIKCGSYKGNTTNKPEIYLGFEPQFFLTKKTNGTADWILLDSMRGLPTADTDKTLAPNSTAAEGTGGGDLVDVTPTGVKQKGSYDTINGHGDSYVYIAIRRLDPLVQKPAEAGTDVFAIDTGDGDSTIPNFDSGFPVDLALQKPTTQGYTGVYARLLGHHVLYTPTSGAEQDESDGQSSLDSNLGYGSSSDFQTSSTIAWMWKRHAGFDVVTDTSAEWVRHSLNRVPEMVIIKDRIGANSWFVWHKDLNGGGSNSIGYFLGLNGNAAQANWGNVCPIGNTLPTATHFQTDSDSAVRNANCIAFLFASVDGISKVGSYTGSTSDLTIECGFQPRFVIIKSMTDAGYSWVVLDSTRGWGSGNDNYLQLNSNAAEVSYDMGAPTSSGFTVDAGSAWVNGSTSRKYIYYAHA